MVLDRAADIQNAPVLANGVSSTYYFLSAPLPKFISVRSDLAVLFGRTIGFRRSGARSDRCWRYTHHYDVLKESVNTILTH